MRKNADRIRSDRNIFAQAGALVLRAQDLRAHAGARLLFDLENLEIHGGERIALVGPNGAGKTTLMRLLSGWVEPEEGSVRTYVPVAYIPQLEEGDPVDREIFSRQLDYWGVPDEPHSGGEKTRMKIARAFGRESGLLLCDEPSANLDEEGIAAFEDAIAGYQGAMVIISHDRELLNRFCNRVWELRDGELRVYRGDWDQYLEETRRLRRQAEAEYEDYIRQRDALEEAIEERSRRARRMNKAPSRMGNSEARLHRREATEKSEKLQAHANSLQTRLARLEVKAKPQELPKVRFLTLPGEREIFGDCVLKIEDLTFAYPGQEPILKDLSLELHPGERLALTGANGSGKSTLLRLIRDQAPGVFMPASVRASFGFFAQDLTDLPPERTLIDYVSEEAKLDRSNVRWVLVRLGLDTPDWNKKLGQLSGGERCRAQMARLLCGLSPLLLLDEPTNYLDFSALEGLEEMLKEFGGTVVYVSHDRYFRRQTATRVLRLENGALRE